MTFTEKYACMEREREEKSMKELYVLHDKNGNTVLHTASEIIRNAIEQRDAGVKPCYMQKLNSWYSPAGWLVWSGYIDGAIVVYPRESDGKMIIARGWQGEFVFTL